MTTERRSIDQNLEDFLLSDQPFEIETTVTLNLPEVNAAGDLQDTVPITLKETTVSTGDARDRIRIDIGNIQENAEARAGNITLKISYPELEDWNDGSNESRIIQILNWEEISGNPGNYRANRAYYNYPVTIKRKIYALGSGQYSLVGSWAPGDQISDITLIDGLISTCSLTGSPETGGTITFGVTNSWGDFVRVNGRLTSDSAHRALGITSAPDIEYLKDRGLEKYATDYGFSHADRSVNVIAKYTSKEVRYRYRKKGGISGWFGKMKEIKEEYDEQREVDLRFNLNAKNIPVVYGVQKTSSIPIFADLTYDTASGAASTDETIKSSTVYLAAALCEGEIGGVFDIHIDGNPLVCVNESDETARGVDTTNENVPLTCFGRMDRGNVLKGNGLYFDPTQEEGTIFYTGWGTNPNVPAMFDGGGSNSRWYRASVIYNNLFNNIGGQNANLTGGNGLGHEQPFLLEEQNDVPQTSITVHAGKPHQRANQFLIEKANTDEFVFQDSGYALDKSAYWTNNHKVLDTAYIVAKFLVTEGEYSVPDLEFVVKGKFIQCYNYDGSFAPFYPEDHPTAPQDDTLADNFQLGTVVELQATANDWTTATVLNNTVAEPTQIIDRFYFYDKTGRKQWRFRLASPISDADKATYDRFRIVELDSGSSNVWEFVGYDYKKVAAAAGITLRSPLLGTNDASSALDGNNNLVITYTNPGDSFYTDLYNVLYDSQGDIRKDAKNVPLDIYVTINLNYTFKVLSVVDPSTLGGGNGTITLAAESSLYERYRINVDEADLDNIHISNVIFDTVSFSNPPIQEDIVEFKVSNLGVATQTIDNTVAAYISPISAQSSTNATVLQDFNLPEDSTFTGSYELNITPSESDFRVSTNPAMQLLDYITAERYGAGLDIDNDIDLESFTDAATLCDSTSDVIMKKEPGSDEPAAGDKIAAYYTDGTLMWQGTYAGKYTDLDGTQYSEYYLFTDCIGKIGRKVNNYTLYKNGEAIWNNGSAYTATQDFSTYVTASDLGGAGFSSLGTTLILNNLTNPLNSPQIDIRDSIATAEGNPIVRGPGGQPGYSLHDSDLVQYWKYVGWESPEQRWVTRHQMNQVINTDTSVFANINSMLRQFNGILTYSNDKYFLNVKTAMPESASGYWESGVTLLSDENIIGNITVKDTPKTEKYNAVTASIPDPAKLFSNNSINFFDSQALKEDNNIYKKGTYNVPGITNYLAARTNVIQYLEEARESAKLSFTLDAKAYLLFVGNVIKIQSDTLGWGTSQDPHSGKTVRIESLTLNKNGTVSVNAVEHDDFNFLIKYETRNNNDQEQTDSFSVDPVEIAAPNFMFAAQPAKYSFATDPPSIDLSVAFPQGTNLNNLRVEIWAFPHQVPGPGLESDVTYRPVTNKGPVDVDERPVAWLNGSYEKAILAWEGPATTFQQSTDNNDGSSNSSQSKITWQLPDFLIDPLEEITLNAADPNAGTVVDQWTSAAVPFFIQTRYDKRWVSFWCRATSIDGRKKSSYWPPVDTPQPVSMTGYRSFVNASNVTHCGGFCWFSYGSSFEIIWPSEVVTLTADTDGTITNLADSVAEVKVLRNGRLIDFNPGSGGVGGGLWDMTVTLNDVVVPEPTLVGTSNAHVTSQGSPRYAILNQIQGLEDSNGDPVLSGTITYTVVSDDLQYADLDVVQTSFTRKFRLIQFGADQWKIRGSNETHVFSVVPGGTPTNDFLNVYTVERSTPAGDQPYTWSSDTTVDFSSQGTFNNNDYWFRYSVDPGIASEISGTNCTPEVNSSDGTITISSSGASPDILQDEDVTEATIFVPFEALHSDINLHTTLYNPGGAGTSAVSTLRDQGVPDPGFRTITLHKAIRGVRGGEFYVIRASQLGLTEAEYNAWAQDPDLIAGANTTSALLKILTYIMGPGIWSSGTTYASGERVHYQGSDYLSQQSSNTGNEPFVGSSFWTATSNNDKLSPDRFIRPNDVITISNDVSTAEEAVAAATRIYEGIGYSNPKTPGVNDFSSLVVETFDGSVIVKGTLSADKIAANQGIFNQLRVGSNIVIGETPADWVEGQVYGLGSVVRGVNPDVNLYEYISTTGSVATSNNKPISTNPAVGQDNGTWYNYGNLGHIGWLYTRDHSTFGDASAGFYMDYAGNFEARTASGGGLIVDAENDTIELKGSVISTPVGSNIVSFKAGGSAILALDAVAMYMPSGTGFVYSESAFTSPAVYGVIGAADKDFEFGLITAVSSVVGTENFEYYWDYVGGVTNTAQPFYRSGGSYFSVASAVSALPGDYLQIKHDGRVVRFFKNGALIGSVSASGNPDNTIYQFLTKLTDPDGSNPPNYPYIFRDFGINKGYQGLGDPSPVIALSISPDTFFYDANDSRLGSTSPTISAIVAGGPSGETPYYEFQEDGVTGTVQSSSTYSGFSGVPATKTADSIEITVNLRYANDINAAVVASATKSINLVNEFNAATTVTLTNSNHTFPADVDGDVAAGDRAGSGTLIEVYEGNVRLTATSGPLADGTFQLDSVTPYVVSPSGGVTVGNATYNSNPSNIEIADVTAVSSSIDSTTVTYNVDIQRFDGSTEARTVVQTYSKSKSGQDGVPGKVARLNLSSYTTGFDDSNDTSPTPTSVTLTGSAQGYDTPEYQFEKKENGDGAFTVITNGAYSTTATNTFTFTTGASAQSKLPVEFRVLVREDSNDTNPTQDSCTVAGVVGGDDGSPAKSVRLTADSQVFKVAKDGTVTPSTITFDATLQNTTAGSATFTTSPVVTLGGTGNQATLFYTDFSDQTANPTKAPVTVTATKDTSFSDSITVVQLEEGSDAVTAVLGNESHTFQADNAGTVSNFSGGTTTIQVYEGATALTFQVDNTVATSAGEFKMSKASSGISSPGVGNYSGDGTTTCTTSAPTAMSADNATITYTITGNRADGTAFSISKVQSFSKSKAGTDGDGGLSGVLTNESHTVAANADGTGYSLTGAGGTFEVFSGASKVTSGLSFSGGATQNGLTISINASTGVYSLSGASPSWTSDEETFTLTATYNSQNITKTYTINKAKAGSDGTPAKLVSIEPLSRQAIEFDADEVIGSSASITMVSNTQGFTDPWFSYTPATWVTGAAKHDGSNADSDTVTINPNTTYSNYPVQITVNVYEGNTTTVVAQDTVTLFAVKPGAQGDAAETIRLSSDAQIFTEAKDGTLSPSSITFTANRQNISTATTFTSSPVVTLSGTGDTRTLANSDFGSNTAVTVTATANSLSDEITIVRVVEGSDAYTVILTNEAHVLPADNSGTVTSYTGSGTDIVAYKGATELNGITSGTPGSGQFKVTSATGSNITVGSVSSPSNPIVYADASNMTADTAKITYTISLENALTITKVQTFSKSKEGPTGAAGPGASGFFTIESSSNLDDAGGDNGLGDAFGVINSGNVWTSGGGRNPLVQGDLIIVIDTDYSLGGVNAGDFPVVSLKAKASADGKELGTGANPAAASGDFLVQSTDYIDGNLVVTGTIAGEALVIHQDQTGSNSSLTIGAGGKNRIEIFDTGNLRVRLGDLS